MSKKKNTEHEESCSKSTFGCIFTKKNLIFIAIFVLLIIQFFQIRNISNDFSFLQNRDSSLVTEIGQLKEAYTLFGEDMNEIRQYLLLDTKSYLGFEEPVQEETNDEKNEDQIQLAMFKYINYLSTQENLDENIAAYKGYLEALISSEEFGTFLETNSLSLSELNEDDFSVSLSVNNADGNQIVFYYLSKEDGLLYQKTINSKEEVSYESSEDAIQKIQAFVESNFESLNKVVTDIQAKKEQVEAAINSEETQAKLSELGITLTTEYTEEESKIIYSVLNNSGTAIGQIVIDPSATEILVEGSKIQLVDLNDDSASLTVTDISTALVPFLEKLDTSTLIQKKANEALIELNKTLNDEGFKLLLSEAGLTISEEPREDDERIYFDIYNSEETHVSSIVIEKMTGVINIVQPDGANAENILFFDPEFKKKTLEIPDEIPEYSDELTHEDNTFNILIAGKHGNLVDTMIFAHANEDTRTVRMISIPRDLYYNGRKINSFAYYYGMPELKRVLSEMTGYELDKYILIDMYAFIDVIDLIGGIDIHLDNAVIDPTYRTVDDGVVGTLHYEPGDYHLGGVEALRLARSRHTSSDFARAERQQLIIKAIQDKARNFGFGDADTIYEIAKSILNKTETDISLDEAIAYYFRYQNYEIESNAVMSSGNVLYVPPYITVENCNNMIAQAAAAGQPNPGCSGQNHAYTLLPRNNNWNIIKWFFQENFEAV